jgi:hypothetical protein
MTDAERLANINRGLRTQNRVTRPDAVWLLERITQLEKEVQNLRDALASG